jgi:hypothetical protein
VGSTAGVTSGLSPGAEKAREDLQTTYVPNGTTDIIINSPSRHIVELRYSARLGILYALA